MDKIVIRGGERLKGSVAVSGAKNAALPLLASVLLTERPVRFTNVPRLADISTMVRLLENLGVEVTAEHPHEVVAHAKRLSKLEAPYDLVKTMRASVLVLGPLVARMGRARVSLPGGCAIGARPIDQHLKGLEALGANIELEHGYVEASAKRLRGGRVTFDMVTVTGTENLLMAASLAKGETVLENCATEPEVTALVQMLVAMGARIEGAGKRTIHIQGVDELGHNSQPEPLHHEVMPDRIEAGTLAVAAVLTRGDVTLTRCNPKHMKATLDKLESSGANLTVGRTDVRVQMSGAPKPLRFKTAPYPGLATDMQAQLMVLATQAAGKSHVTETIFENRFMHVQELGRLGAEIDIHDAKAVISGPRQLSGSKVMATDLRASASLVLAGLVAEGRTEVLRVYHLDRGYERLDKKLRALGADVRRERGSF